MAALVMERGPEVGTRFPLGEQTTTLGRSPENDIVLELRTISRWHAAIRREGDTFVLEDVQSTNGTFLNDEPVTRRPLEEGDRIRLGQVVFRFTESAAATTEAAVELVSTDRSGNTASVIERMEVDGHGLLAAGGAVSLAQLQHRLALVSQISSELLQLLDVQQLADRVADRLLAVFPNAEQALVAVVEEETGELRPRAARRRGGELTRGVSLSQTIFRLVTEGREAVLCADVGGDVRFRDRPSIVGRQIRSFLCVPLVCRGEFLGALYVDSRRLGAGLERDDLILATAIAGQVALAVSNIRLHRSIVARERLELDLSRAEELQRSFLPASTPDVPGMTFAPYYATAYEVGGDFYDFIPLDAGRLLVVIGDVSGKGISAALMMARLTRDIRYYAARSGLTDVLGQLSRDIAHETEGRIFASLLCMEVHPAERRIVMANAGHCPPVICPADAEPHLFTGAGSFLLGVVPEEPYEAVSLTLSPGDTVLAYTDGVTDAMNAAGATFGSARLLEATAGTPTQLTSGQPPSAGPAPFRLRERGEAASAESLGGRRPQGLLDSVLAALRAHCGDAEPTDDLTMVAFSWQGSTGRPS